jgi:hypothetical protein
VPTQEDPDSHIDLLQRCIHIAAHLSPSFPIDIGTLWHNDLNLQNIMVSDDANPRIVSLIDWQNVAVRPLYLQYCELPFLQIDDKELSDDDQQKNELRELQKLYHDCILRSIPDIRSVLRLPYAESQKTLILESGRSWTMRNKIISLRQGLINFWRSWSEWGLHGPCPITFSKEELENHIIEGQGANENWEFIIDVMSAIGMSQTGEVPADDYEERRRVYEDIKQLS